jgi:hypothetical protein
VPPPSADLPPEAVPPAPRLPSLPGIQIPTGRDEFADDGDEATVVSQAPMELLQRAGLEEEANRAELADWKRVYDDFVRVKKECGEPVEGLTFERFQGTLRKNKENLLARHPGSSRVRFTVYTKDGRAALKASPTKD